ncbi:Uncharacterised protein [Dermatophilus congolensis]|uniref:Uncharacterized protein n=1 Tax=Dermatophilus congolensis TaxID=1863 RepID=A0AA46BPH5_9MICO|nr:Uncharacterised protein [Dermatophilus congolensis]
MRLDAAHGPVLGHVVGLGVKGAGPVTFTVVIVAVFVLCVGVPVVGLCWWGVFLPTIVSVRSGRGCGVGEVTDHV